MQLKDVMTKNVEVVRPDSTLQEAAQKMKSLDVGPLPVCENDKLIGMLTDRDITVRAAAEGLDPKQTKVREVMSEEMVTCMEDQDVQEAAAIMRSKQIRRVPVLNREKRLVGIVSLGDLAVETGDPKLAGKTLKDISAPTKSSHK
jgi:CBS domain-containing protein